MAFICNQCPRHCNVQRSDKKVGFCGSPDALKIARAALHQWEEPCLSANGGAGAVFFSGCNLRCIFCQNYDISHNGNSGVVVNVEQLRKIFRNLISQGAQNIDLVTPTHYTEQIIAALSPQPEVPVVWNSNGYENVNTLKLLSGKVQIYLPDLKYADNELARKFSSASDYFDVAKSAIDEMYKQVGPYQLAENGRMLSGVIIRHLIIPGHLENTFAVIDYVAKNFRPGEVMFSLMRQYLPYGEIKDYPELNRKVSDDEYELAETALFASGIEDGFVQDADSATEDFIPAFDGTGVVTELD